MGEYSLTVEITQCIIVSLKSKSNITFLHLRPWKLSITYFKNLTLSAGLAFIQGEALVGVSGKASLGTDTLQRSRDMRASFRHLSGSVKGKKLDSRLREIACVVERLGVAGVTGSPV